ncbi:MAG: cupin domain-containing protein [Saprospiraceae bacterium]|nr:cupin domain-containing protein [Saprospiraceae bacterium]
MKVVNVKEKLASFSEHWDPRIAGTLNGQMVKLAKIKGDFIWHSHENEDELFWVIKGTLHLDFRDKSVSLKEGEFIIVPKGVEHRPWTADGEEVHIMLFEPASTINTGEIEGHELTRSELKEV